MSNNANLPTLSSGSRKDWLPLIKRVEGILDVVSNLRVQLGLMQGGLMEEPVTMRLHEVFVDYVFNNLADLIQASLRPIAEEAVFVDMPTGKSFKFLGTTQSSRAGRWLQAFPDFNEHIFNVIGNERYLVLERRATGTHRNALTLGSRVIEATGRKLDIELADVIEFKKGQAIKMERYYDMGGVLRSLGLMRNIPLGHDEWAATPAPMMHPSGFLPKPGEMRSKIQRSVKIGSPISIGSGKTRQAQTNIANCTAIHGAFINHAPQEFKNLIAADAVWIDVPTGEVLNGAVAAAHHDHGNWQTAFPDSSAEVTNMIANDDWVVVQHRGFGTHLGPIQLGGKTYPPTGRQINIRVLDVVQYKNGAAILIRNNYDMCMMLLQLGIPIEEGSF